MVVEDEENQSGEHHYIFVHKIFKIFTLTFWLCRKNGSSKMIKLILKFMMSQFG